MRVALLFALLLAAPVAAQAPSDTLRPQPRPANLPQVLPGNAVSPPDAAAIARQIEGALADAAMAAPRVQARPPARPAARPSSRPTEAAQPRRSLLGRLLPGGGGARPEPVAGSVCNDPSIRGESIPDVPGRIAGCGIADPVRLTAVSGITLSQAATVDCDTARALKSWIDTGARSAVGRKGGGLSGLRVAAHYACRPRNNRPGAKVSEHGRGKAIDISAVLLADGSEISVKDGWGSRRNGKMMRRLHASACGPFGTVLGPGSDAYHQDHLHFDTARSRSGPYCR